MSRFCGHLKIENSVLVRKRILKLIEARTNIIRIASLELTILRRFEHVDKYKDLYERPLESDWVANRLPSIKILLASGV